MPDNEKMKKESEFWSLMFLAIGAASFLAQLIQVRVVFKKGYFNSDISSPVSSVVLILQGCVFMNGIQISVRWSSNNFRLCSCGHQLFQQLVSFQGAEELLFNYMFLESFLVPIINITLSSNVIGLKDHVFSTYWLPIIIFIIFLNEPVTNFDVITIATTTKFQRPNF